MVQSSWVKCLDGIAFLPAKRSCNLRQTFCTILFIISNFATSSTDPFLSISCMSTLSYNHNVSTNILRDHLFQTVSYSGQVKLKFQDIYCQQESDQLHLLCKFYLTIYQEFMVVFDRWIIFSKHMQSIFWIIDVRFFFKPFSNLFLNIFINISGPYLI